MTEGGLTPWVEDYTWRFTVFAVTGWNGRLLGYLKTSKSSHKPCLRLHFTKPCLFSSDAGELTKINEAHCLNYALKDFFRLLFLMYVSYGYQTLDKKSLERTRPSLVLSFKDITSALILVRHEFWKNYKCSQYNNAPSQLWKDVSMYAPILTDF